MYNKYFFVLAGVALIFMCTTPVRAEESNTTAVSTASQVEKSNKATFDELLKQWREKLKQTKASSTAMIKNVLNEKPKLGSALKTVDAPCVQKAVDVREVAIQKAWTTFNTSIGDALLVRQKALYDAWGLTDVSARTTALKGAWAKWKDDHKNTVNALKKARTDSWKAYRTTMQNECKAVVPAEERLSKDETGSLAL